MRKKKKVGRRQGKELNGIIEKERKRTKKKYEQGEGRSREEQIDR